MSSFFKKIYHWILRFFFDCDVNVYRFKDKEPNIHSFLSYKYFRIRIANFLAQKPKVKRKKLKIRVKTQNYGIIDSSVLIRRYTVDFWENLLLKDIWLDFFTICKNYLVYLKDKFSKINNIILIFSPVIKKFSKRDLILSKKVTTEKEIITIEPYTNILQSNQLLQIPVEKEPVDISILSKKQMEILREKLAISAKCKKYSIKVENIYGDFTRSLYSNVELQKDNKVLYKFKNEPEEDSGLYMFVTGKKRYDTDLRSTIVSYKDLGL